MSDKDSNNAIKHAIKEWDGIPAGPAHGVLVRAAIETLELRARLSAVSLSPADLDILKRLRDNEKRASMCVGHLGDDLRRKYEEAVVLLDRLIGASG